MQRLKRLFTSILNCGLSELTPPHLIDRIVYSNWVSLIIAFIVILAAWANLVKGHLVLLGVNSICMSGVALCFILNRRHQYLSARRTLLLLCYIGLFIGCIVQGNVAHMEHYFLPAGVLAYSMFHPLERRSAAFFILLSAIFYLFFVNRASPLLDFDPHHDKYGPDDLHVNQFLYITLFVSSLVGLSNAYARAIAIVEEQRAKIFEQNRLSLVGLASAKMAHEINTPLATVDLQLHFLEENLEKDSGSSQENLETVQRVRKIVSRVSTIMRGFKSLSRTDSNEAIVPAKISELIHSGIDLFESRLKTLAVSFSVDIADPDQTVACRPVALSQVILNLLSNAMDAVEKLNKTERWIRLTAAVHGDRLRISITNAGSIDSEITRKKLFDPFFTTKPIGKGTGLGLSISKQTVEQHHGRIYLDPSRIHTQFIIELPIEKRELT